MLTRQTQGKMDTSTFAYKEEFDMVLQFDYYGVTKEVGAEFIRGVANALSMQVPQSSSLCANQGISVLAPS